MYGKLVTYDILYSIALYGVLFYSILFSSVLFYSNPIRFYSILFCSAIHYSKETQQNTICNVLYHIVFYDVIVYDSNVACRAGIGALHGPAEQEAPRPAAWQALRLC